MERAKTALIGLFGSSTAFGSVGVSTEARIEIWLRIAVLLAGLLSALISVYWMYRINRVRIRKYNEQLCDACRGGHVPSHCPIPVNERPADCPLA